MAESVWFEGLPEQPDKSKAVEVIAWCEEKGEKAASFYAIFANGNFYLGALYVIYGADIEHITHMVKKWCYLPTPI